jgi:hypothetical protein
MRGCKQLKNINSVSGKLGERHFDPLLPVTTVRFAADLQPKRREIVTNRSGVASRLQASSV